VCDVSDAGSLLAMAQQARCVIAAVGPYRFYGRPVVHACVEAGCHYVDVSGEPEFIERMEAEFHRAAEAKGLVCVSACGFDSIVRAG
jgi:short subunit dehydrogenase-like uncharacterized protein